MTAANPTAAALAPPGGGRRTLLQAFGWAALLGVNVAENLTRSASSDITGALIAVALVVSLLVFGAHLVSSSKARSFFGESRQ
mgnify:CR=1 FL=1